MTIGTCENHSFVIFVYIFFFFVFSYPRICRLGLLLRPDTHAHTCAEAVRRGARVLNIHFEKKYYVSCNIHTYVPINIYIIYTYKRMHKIPEKKNIRTWRITREYVCTGIKITNDVHLQPSRVHTRISPLPLNHIIHEEHTRTHPRVVCPTLRPVCVTGSRTFRINRRKRLPVVKGRRG
jgi:hypothetical protein